MKSASQLIFNLDRPDQQIEDIPTVLGSTKLMRRMAADQSALPLYQELVGRLGRDKTDVVALMDLAVVAETAGVKELGITLRSTAIKSQRLYRLASDGPSPQLRLLGFAMPGQITANMPIEFLVEDSEVELLWLFLVPGMPMPPVPDHDLAIVLVAESDEARPYLRGLEPLLATWPRPVLNRPERVPLLGRENLYRLMNGLDDVVIPPVARVDAARLADVGRRRISIEAVLPESCFPIIVRPIDSHAGHGLVKLDTVAEIDPYLAQHPPCTTHYLAL